MINLAGLSKNDLLKFGINLFELQIDLPGLFQRRYHLT